MIVARTPMFKTFPTYNFHVSLVHMSSTWLLFESSYNERYQLFLQFLRFGVLIMGILITPCCLVEKLVPNQLDFSVVGYERGSRLSWPRFLSSLHCVCIICKHFWLTVLFCIDCGVRTVWVEGRILCLQQKLQRLG